MIESAELLRQLSEVGALLRDVTNRSEDLYRRRVELLDAGRRLKPPLTIAAMAAALGQSPKAIDQVLVKERRKATS